MMLFHAFQRDHFRWKFLFLFLRRTSKLHIFLAFVNFTNVFYKKPYKHLISLKRIFSISIQNFVLLTDNMLKCINNFEMKYNMVPKCINTCSCFSARYFTSKLYYFRPRLNIVKKIASLLLKQFLWVCLVCFRPNK